MNTSPPRTINHEGIEGNAPSPSSPQSSSEYIGENSTQNADLDENADVNLDPNDTDSIDDDANSYMTEINISNNNNTFGDGFPSNDNNRNVSNSNNDNNNGIQRWTDEQETAYEQRRRQSLAVEIDRVQRSNFIHFSILCLIPIGLLALVLINSYRYDGDCEGYEISGCERETRTFTNAFDNRCVCFAVTVEVET